MALCTFRNTLTNFPEYQYRIGYPGLDLERRSVIMSLTRPQGGLGLSLDGEMTN